MAAKSSLVTPAPSAAAAATAPASASALDQSAGTDPDPAGRRKPASGSGRREKRARGWGPYKSVLKERSVAFNLTLDVQQLQQEVRELTTLRDLRRSQALNQRHERDGSLVKTVREFYHLFRYGYWLDPSVRGVNRDTHSQRHNSHSYCDSYNDSYSCPERLDTQQRAFLESVMADHVDVGGGFRGIGVLLEQMVVYARCFREFRVELRRFDVVQAEDAVTITTHADVYFRIAREMVRLVFPHVAHHEALLAQLVDRRVVSDMRVTFNFKGGGLGGADGLLKSCDRYNVDVGFVTVFARLLRDPRDTQLLVGRARIAPNSMLAVDPNSIHDERCSDARLVPAARVVGD